MTIRMLIVGNSVALVLLGITVYFTRAKLRRLVGALIAGASVAVLIVGVDALARELGWWYYPSSGKPYQLFLMYLAAALWYGAGVALIGWRLIRRFGWRGLAALLGVMGIVGPLRDYAGAALTGAIVFAPGILPVLGDVVCWVGGMAFAQAVMRLVAGPARKDKLRQSARTSHALPA